MKQRAAYVLFILLSLTWGLPMTLVGAAVCLAVRLDGVRPRRFGPCLYMTVGAHWGGLSLGPFLFTDPHAPAHTLLHESGHAVQDVLFGPAMPLLVSLPSAARYWLRALGERRGRVFRRGYEDVWFERQATRLGFRCFGTLVRPPRRRKNGSAV